MAADSVITRRVGDVEQARRQILADLRTYEERVIEKKRQLNCLLPIYRLPHELLVEIFLLVITETRRADTHESRSLWFKHSQVCHHWREVSLNSAIIWSSFLACGYTWTRELLKRSRNAPLNIEAYAPYHTNKKNDVCKLVLKEMKRIKSLRLTIGARDKPVTYPIAPSAPVLSSLVLTLPATNIVGPTLFDEVHMPALKSLEINDQPISWSNPLLKPTLTCLSLRGANNGSSNPDTMGVHAALRALAGLPHLRELTLINIFPLTVATAASATLVSLPQLRSMKISAAPLVLVKFMDHVSFPPVACLTLTYQNHTSRDLDLRSLRHLCGVLSTTLQTPDSMPTTADAVTAPFLSVYGKVSSYCRLIASTTRLELDELAPERMVAATGTFWDITVLPPSYAGSEACFDALYAALPMHSVQQLMVQDERYMSTYHREQSANRHACWENILKASPDLRHLGASRELQRGLAAALGPVSSTDVNAGHGQTFSLPPVVPVPDLEVLSLRNITARSYDRRKKIWDETIKEYCEALGARKDAGHKLEEVRLLECKKVDRTATSAVRAVVKRLYWDEEPKPKAKAVARPRRAAKA